MKGGGGGGEGGGRGQGTRVGHEWSEIHRICQLIVPSIAQGGGGGEEGGEGGRLGRAGAAGPAGPPSRDPESRASGLECSELAS